MKKTKKAWLFLGLQLLFMIVVPIAFIWMQYGVFSLKYKISVTSILLMLLIFLIFKKIFINNWFCYNICNMPSITTNICYSSKKLEGLTNESFICC